MCTPFTPLILIRLYTLAYIFLFACQTHTQTNILLIAFNYASFYLNTFIFFIFFFFFFFFFFLFQLSFWLWFDVLCFILLSYVICIIIIVVIIFKKYMRILTLSCINIYTSTCTSVPLSNVERMSVHGFPFSFCYSLDTFH